MLEPLVQRLHCALPPLSSQSNAFPPQMHLLCSFSQVWAYRDRSFESFIAYVLAAMHLSIHAVL